MGGSRKRKLSWNVTAPDVLHGPGVELGHEELVVLAEGIAPPEQVGVVVHALAGDLEDLVRAALQLGAHRSAAVEPQGDAVVRRLDRLDRDRR